VEQPGFEQLPIQSVMSTPVVTLPEAELTDFSVADDKLHTHAIHHLPLVGDRGQCVGLITRHSLYERWRAFLCHVKQNGLLQTATGELRNIHHIEAERQQIEAALRDSERRFSSLAAAAPVGIFRTDDVGQCLYVNEQWCQIAGLTPEEAHGFGWVKGIHPDDRDRVFEAWAKATQARYPFRLEYRFQRPDGFVTWLYGQAVAEVDENGTILGYVGTITDINDRKATEEALEVQRDFNRAIAEITSRFVDLEAEELDAEITHTLKRIGEITPHVDESFVVAFAPKAGLLEQEGDRSFQITHEWHRLHHPVTFSTLQSLSFSDFPWSIEFLQQRHCVYVPSVAELPAEAAVDQANWQQLGITSLLLLPILQKSQVTGFMGVTSLSQPITWEEETIRLLEVMLQAIANAQERIHDKHRLFLSEERLRLTLQAANQGLYDLNLQTGEAVVNREYATMLGYDPDIFQETNAQWMARLHPDDRHKVAQTYLDYISGVLPEYKVEFRQRTQRGDYKWILSLGKIVAWDADGNPLRMLGTHTDISDLKKAQEQAQHRLDILEVARDIVASADHAGNITYMNQSARTLLGIAPDEDITHTSIADCHPPHIADMVLQEALPQCVAQGFWAGETLFRRRDGSDLPVWQVIVAHHHQDGSVSHFSTIARDLRDRKQAEQERLLAEQTRRELQLLENILDNILAGYWDSDLVTGQQYISPGFKRMFGYEDHELPNSPDTWKTLVFQDDLPKAIDAFTKHVESRGKIPYYNELRYHHKNGSTVWVICSGRVIEWDAMGNPLRLIGCHIDITRRKLAEEKLLKSDAHLKTAQRIGKLGSWEFNLRTQAIAWSDEVFRIFGRDPALGTPSYEELHDLYHPDDRTMHDQVVQEAIATVQPYEVECRAYRSDGELVYIQARGEPIFDAAGTLIQLVGTVLDITERKLAEQQLKNLSDRLALALKSGAIATWEWEIPNNSLNWDERMYELYGVAPNEFTSVYDAWASRLHPEDREKTEAAIQNALNGSKDYDPEFRVVHADGTVRIIQAYALVQRNDQGEPICMTGINYDITDRKLAEDTLRRTTAQLEASNRELEAFAYSVSHDLRSPLRAIDGFSQALLEDYGHQFDNTAQDYFQRIRRNVQRMGTLIDDLLRLSRVSRSEMQYDRVNLSALVLEQLDELQAAEPTRQVECVVIPDITVAADPTLLRVVVANLIQNAWKFTSHHPTARIEFGVMNQNEQLVYFVKDDGAGFDMAYAKMLFGVFQRLHNTHEFPGTGIGLATVQRAIHRHGGQVWAEGAVEQGATIYFTIPSGIHS
jgi:PAS domain S-box-containing protein